MNNQSAFQRLCVWYLIPVVNCLNLFTNKIIMAQVINGNRILVFEDDLAVLEVIKSVLEEVGYIVETSLVSHNIIVEVENFLPDLILMDAMIPEIGGVEAIKLLRKNDLYKNIPIILMTASLEIKLLAKKAGIDHYIAKPFDLEEFENLVKIQLEKTDSH